MHKPKVMQDYSWTLCSIHVHYDLFCENYTEQDSSETNSTDGIMVQKKQTHEQTKKNR